jgi:hypothetical protein
MNDQWYYFAQGVQQGPVSLSRIRELVLDGTVSRASEIWKQGTPDWVPLAKVDELRDLCTPTPRSAVHAPGPAKGIVAEARATGSLRHSPPLAGAVAAAVFYLLVSVVNVFCAVWLARTQSSGMYSLVFIIALLILLPIAAARIWRTAFEIDPQNNVIVRHGPLATLFESRHSGREFVAVAIIPRLRSGSHGRSELDYLLELQGSKRAVRIACEKSSSVVLGLAEDVATRLNLDLIDGIENPPIVRRARTSASPISLSSSNAIYEHSAAVFFPPLSARLQSFVHLDGNQATIRLPSTGYGCLAIWMFFAVAGIGLIGYIGFQSGHPGVIAMWSAIIGLPLLVGLALAAPTQTTVEGNPDSIRLTTTAFGIRSTQTISTSDVREIRREFKSISIRTRDRSFGFACFGMSEEDAETVRDLLTQLRRRA